MRVAILAYSVLAGDATGRHTCDVARALMKDGHQVSIGYRGLLTRTDRDIRALCRWIGPGDPLPEADVYIYQYSGWYPLAEHLRTPRGRSIFWYHGVTPPDMWGSTTDRDTLERSVFGCMLAHYADLAVADSPFGATELQGYESALERPPRVIGIPVDVRPFTAPGLDDEARALRRQLGAEDRRIVLYVGRLAGNKRVDLLISAIGRLVAQMPDLLLLVVGDDKSSPAYAEYAARLRDQVAQLGLADHIRMTGKVPRVEPYYSAADLLVLPSEHEGFGVPLVEAMAAGVPVIASRAGAMPWVMGADTGEPAGLLFETGSEEKLAEAISRVLCEPGLAEALRSRGRARATLFSPEAFERATVALVREAGELSDPLSARGKADETVLERADVALREYRVRSRAPVVARLIEWVRVNMTSHLKEAYVDRIVERQVMYNIATSKRIEALEAQVAAQAETIRVLTEQRSWGRDNAELPSDHAQDDDAMRSERG